MERFLKGICMVALSLLILSVSYVGVVLAEGTSEAPEIEAVVENAASATDSMNLVYQSKAADYGWLESVTNDQVAGVVDQNLPINAFAISIPSSIGTISARGSVAGQGWQNWTDGTTYIIGTQQSENPLEAVQMKLTGAAADQYDLYYSVQLEDLGWLDYAKNGETAGDTDLGKAIVAIKVTYTSKGAPAPGQAQGKASLDAEDLRSYAHVNYAAHVSDIGWQDPVSDGQTAGTTGEGKALEALTISMPDAALISADSGINYKVESQQIGWQPVVGNNAAAGTVGQGLKAEAVTVELTGKASEIYDAYYRVHSKFYGWLDWAKNGEIAGTTGIDTPAEAIEVRLALKGDPAPGPTDRPSVTREYLQSRANISYNTSVQNGGWQNGYSNGADAGTIGENRAIEAFKLEMPNHAADTNVYYQAHVTDVGWMEPVRDGMVAGAEGKAIQAITASLSGEDAYSYDLYYQVYVQDYGWLGWAKNGEYAGTTGAGKAMEAVHFILQPRNTPAPGSSENAYLDLTSTVNQGWIWPLEGYTNLSSEFGPRWGTNHDGIDIPAPGGTPIYAAHSGTVIVADWYFGYGQCVIVSNDTTGEDVYYAHMSQINRAVSNVNAHVNQGELLGFVGSTGNSTGNHLHFGVNDHGTFVNPFNYY